jgi:alkaline phosphatase
LLTLAIALAGCEGCGDPRPADIDGGFDDGGVGGDVDGGYDAGQDGGVDDGGFDAGDDAGADAGSDAGLDAGLDAGFDAGFDAGLDADDGTPARNVVLFILDGFAREQLKAARMFDSADTTPFRFEGFAVRGSLGTNNRAGGVTDSAASATAMATGVKVNNGVISRQIPGDGRDLETTLERYAATGRRTGLITQATSIVDATPAAFGAHAASRGHHADIHGDYLTRTRPNVLMGQLGQWDTAAVADAGYTTVSSAGDLSALDAASETHVAALFADGAEPPLADLVTFALALLEQGDDGFFLLVEHEGADNGGHGNDLALTVDAVVQANAAVVVVDDWAAARDDTLIVLTGDHETGGLVVTETSPVAGVLPAHLYSTTSHTPTLVPVFAEGPGAAGFAGSFDNARVYTELTGQGYADLEQGVLDYIGTVDTVVDEAAPTAAAGEAAALTLDDGADGSLAWGALRFEGVLGRVPAGAEVVTAELLLTSTSGGGQLALHPSLRPWGEGSTWLTGDFALDDVSAAAAPSASGTVPALSVATLDVTDDVRAAMSASRAPSWLLVATSGSFGLSSSEGDAPPRLFVRWRR